MRGPSSTPINLAVYGDPIVCRALSLLLEGPDYDVRFIPASALGRPGWLGHVQILLVALGRDTERRKILLASLDERTDDAKLVILELAAFGERRDPWEEPARLGRRVPWPCSTGELKRHIEAALSEGSEVRETDRFGG